MAYDEEKGRNEAHTDEEETEQVTDENEHEKENEELKKALAAEKERSDANLAGWQRATADLANFRKEVERQRGDTVRNANADLLRRLLPIVDDMERAFQTLPADLAKVPWVDGIRLIERKTLSIFEQEGVTPYSALGQEFDPAYHDAIAMEDTDPENDGKVVGEIVQGYRFRDRVLRPALVRVGRGRKT